MTSEELTEARRNLADANAAAAATRSLVRATSTPLILVGAFGVAASTVQWVTGDVFTTVFLIGPMTVAVLAAFGWRERRRSARIGLSGVAGYW